MHVPDRLPRAFVAVGNDAIALFGYPSLRGDFVCDNEYLTHETRVFTTCYVGNARNMFLRNYQNMHRRLRLEIVEGGHVLVLIDQRPDLARGNLAENAILQLAISLPSISLFPIPYSLCSRPDRLR